MESAAKPYFSPESQISILRGILVALLLAFILAFSGFFAYFLGQFTTSTISVSNIVCPGPVYMQPCSQSIDGQCYIHPPGTPKRICNTR